MGSMPPASSPLGISCHSLVKALGGLGLIAVHVPGLKPKGSRFAYANHFSTLRAQDMNQNESYEIVRMQ